MIWDILEQSSFNDYFAQQSLQSLTPEKLLLDQNIITEFKNLNPKLIQYVQSHYDQFLSRLIEYTIILPKETDGDDRVRKLPYVSSEVLAIDSETVYHAFFDWPKDYFNELVGLFNTDAKHNQILSGYFVKILQNLYKCQKKKTAQKIFAFREVFFQNLDKESVATVFSLFLVLLQTDEGYMLNQRKQVIHKLIEQLVKGDQPIRNTCKNVLVDVIAKFQTFSSGDQLIAEILKSQTLLKVFEIYVFFLICKDSKAIDQFLVGFMSKALQKICTSGSQNKSLLEIPESHKQSIKQYISCKKSLLVIQQLPKPGFKNQSHTEVYPLDKKVAQLLTLMKLAMQNFIVGFFTQDNILSLFSLLSLHPSNDIIKVKIFDIFGLIYTKKDIQAQQCFGKYFYPKAIDFFQKEKRMFGHFLYQLWKLIGKKISKEFLEAKDEEKWGELLKYFEQLDNYEKEAQKVVDRYSNLTKVTKLVVDEEDTATAAVESKNENGQKSNILGTALSTSPKKNEETFAEIAKTNQLPVKSITVSSQSKVSKHVDEFSFDFFASKPSPSQISSQPQTKPKVDPFAGFGFFAKPSQEKKDENKKAGFNDFSSFF